MDKVSDEFDENFVREHQKVTFMQGFDSPKVEYFQRRKSWRASIKWTKRARGRDMPRRQDVYFQASSKEEAEALKWKFCAD